MALVNRSTRISPPANNGTTNTNALLKQKKKLGGNVLQVGFLLVIVLVAITIVFPQLARNSTITTTAIQPQQNPPKRLAVVVAGSFLRYSLSSFLKHVARPVGEQQGYAVDYFVALTLQNAPAYRSENGYMNYITWDPLFGQESSSNNHTLPSADDVKSKMEWEFSKLSPYKVHLRHVDIQTTNIDIDAVPEIVAKRSQARKQYPQDEDVDLRFPLLDIRPQARARTANANRNMLRLFWNQKQVWQKLVDYETQQGFSYDYIMVMRDDTEWLEPLDLDLLLKQQQQGETADNNNNQNVDIFLPSCNAREPSMNPLEINDHIAISRRRAASLFGDYFSVLFRPKLLEQCHNRLKTQFPKMAKDRGCNSEMILRYAMESDGFRVQGVGQGYIPMQRAARVKTNGGQRIETCFHKYCQSHDQPLSNHGLRKCKEITNFDTTATTKT